MNIPIDKLQKAVNAELEKIVESEIDEATVRINKRIRERIGQITSNVSQMFSYQDFGNSIKITVDTTGLQKPSPR